MRGLKHFAAVGLVFAGFAGWASSAQAGDITIDTYRQIPQSYINNGNANPGGLEIVAHYNVDPGCCDGPDDTIEFLQMVSLTNGTNGPVTVPGQFNGHSTFIDPQANQTLSKDDNGNATLTTDAAPWYDFTYPNNPLGPANPNNPNGGTGPYIYDLPNGWGGIARNNGGTLNFDATTLVVCADSSTNEAYVLGGFNWGFTVTNPAPAGPITTTIKPITSIGDPTVYPVGDWNDLLGEFADDNGKNDGQSWTLNPLGAACEDCALDVIVPTPSALYGIPVCLVGLVAARRWYMVAA